MLFSNTFLVGMTFKRISRRLLLLRVCLLGTLAHFRWSACGRWPTGASSSAVMIGGSVDKSMPVSLYNCASSASAGRGISQH
jgi:hypothetical protein